MGTNLSKKEITFWQVFLIIVISFILKQIVKGYFRFLAPEFWFLEREMTIVSTVIESNATIAINFMFTHVTKGGSGEKAVYSAGTVAANKNQRR